MIDLRSDTVTRPSPEMLAAMQNAAVGDDVFGDDPSVLALEAHAAELFGMEAALFCVSGTMTNQIGIMVHTHPADEVICHQNSHVYLYEGGGLMTNAHVSVALLGGDFGRLTAVQVQDAIRPDDIHAPRTRLVVLENTMNKGGGAIYDFAEIERISEVCKANGLALHLDGARLFNALAETPETPRDYGRVFDSISICLSKGLGCPVGSLLLGSRTFVKEARRVRKRMGGGWRQAGFLAAAGLYALENNVQRLSEDHRRAKQLADIVRLHPDVAEVLPVPTNIVIFTLKGNLLATDFVKQMSTKGVFAVPFGKQQVRLVTHLDFTDAHLNAFEALFCEIVLPVSAL